MAQAFLSKRMRSQDVLSMEEQKALAFAHGLVEAAAPLASRQALAAMSAALFKLLNNLDSKQTPAANTIAPAALQRSSISLHEEVRAIVELELGPKWHGLPHKWL